MAAQIRAELAHHSIQELQVLLRFVHTSTARSADAQDG
jgi:hypothetical protein